MIARIVAVAALLAALVPGSGIAGALQTDASARATSSAPSAAGLAKIACRIDLARERVETLR